MRLSNDDLRKLKISNRQVFEQMLDYGWVDGLGRSLSWLHWNRYHTAVKSHAKNAPSPASRLHN